MRTLTPIMITEEVGHVRVSLKMQYAQEIKQLDKRREGMRKNISELREQRRAAHKQHLAAIYSGTRQEEDEASRQVKCLNEEIKGKLNELDAVGSLYWNALTNSYRFFFRPELGLPGLLSRLLGPVPKFMPVISPEAEKLSEVSSYRRSGFILLLCTVAALIGLTITIPWLSMSPALLLYGWLMDIMPGWCAVILTLCAGYWFIRLLSGDISPSRQYKGKRLDQMAAYEEQWFRAGAESWSVWQRAYSCIAFGAVHIVNFIYPAASLIVVGAVGGVFMATYLREYRRSGSYERAVLASTKLHASYNKFAFSYLVVAVIILCISGFVW